MNEEIGNNYLYLNQKRIDVRSSKEFFYGKIIYGYLDLLKKGKIISVVRSLVHDAKSLHKKTDTHRIVDFKQGAMTVGEEIVVYTSIYGGYDDLQEPLIKDEKCKYVVFSDGDIPEDSSWEKADESLIPKGYDTPELRNRYVKMFPHRLFGNRYSIYIDGNLKLVGPASMLLQRNVAENQTGIGMHLHPREVCIYEEIDSVLYHGKITRNEKKELKHTYKLKGMPRHFGMFECNVIVRDHNNETMRKIMEKWWDYYSKGVRRDQAYFTLVLYELGYSFDDVMNFGASVNLNPIFIRENHKSVCK
ncbi:MAG: DUF616 domain-containing protein [Lachnospiraceae bacterium]|nr:DUF616 domain-containing protein [Lachnospiraceae bacterium]